MNTKSSIPQAPFKFKNFIISESHIKIKPGAEPDSIDVNIIPNGIIYQKKGLYEIHLKIYLKSNNDFDVYVKMIGLFEFGNVVIKENLTNYFYINAPAIIFPYLRSYISALTALSGCKTVILPPMNMTVLAEDLEKNTVRK
ncbi:MAG: protein-export chaperone SecB [Bacteroidales bacterium]|jgi:preprotein translocase subunit SecB